MTNEMKRETKNEIKRLEALLDGKVVDSLKMGMPGLDEKWIRQAIINRCKMLNNL